MIILRLERPSGRVHPDGPIPRPAQQPDPIGNRAASLYALFPSLPHDRMAIDRNPHSLTLVVASPHRAPTPLRLAATHRAAPPSLSTPRLPPCCVHSSSRTSSTPVWLMSRMTSGTLLFLWWLLSCLVLAKHQGRNVHMERKKRYGWHLAIVWGFSFVFPRLLYFKVKTSFHMAAENGDRTATSPMRMPTYSCTRAVWCRLPPPPSLSLPRRPASFSPSRFCSLTATSSDEPMPHRLPTLAMADPASAMTNPPR